MKLIIIILQAVIIMLLSIACLIFIFDPTWSSKQIFQSCQPTTVTYGSNEPYCLTITKYEKTLRSNYRILVASQKEPSYGNALNYPDGSVIDDRDVEKTKVVWTSDGIELEAYLNTKIFIPKKNFIGGR